MGTKATPRPAATKPWAVGYSSASMAYTGLNPARMQAASMTSRQCPGQELTPIHRSDARSARSTDRFAASGCARGSTTRKGSAKQVPVDEVVVRGVTGISLLHRHEDLDRSRCAASLSPRRSPRRQGPGRRRMQRLESGERAGYERGTRRREGADPDPAAMAGGQRGNGVLGVLDRGEHAGGVLAEQQCGVRRSHPPARPLEEPDTGLVLERGSSAGSRRRANSSAAPRQPTPNRSPRRLEGSSSGGRRSHN